MQFAPQSTYVTEGGKQRPPQPKKTRLTLVAASLLWLCAVGVGLWTLWGYQNTPGLAATPPPQWPAGSHLQPDLSRATLVMFAHPHCPCTRASVGELARLMTQAQDRMTAYVLFMRPANFPVEWEKTDLWASAAAIPGVRVARDDDGAEARRFHAATSGQTLLYDKGGNLLFSGGITGSRGHAGDNSGRSAIVSLLTTGEAEHRNTSVFGCAIFAGGAECRTGKESDHAADHN